MRLFFLTRQHGDLRRGNLEPGRLRVLARGERVNRTIRACCASAIGGAASVVLVLLVAGCGSDSTEPQEPVLDVVLAESTIGPEGGVLAGGDLELVVPAGAFPAQADLSLIRETECDPLGVGAAPYRIEGLPSTWNASLDVRLRRPVAAPDSATLVLGEDVWVTSLAATQTTWRFVHTIADTAWWATTLEPPDGAAKAPRDVGAVDVRVLLMLNRGIHYTSGGHFEIGFDPLTVLPERILALGEYLEEAHAYFQGLGYSVADRTAWPVFVMVRPLSAGQYGFFSPSHWSVNACTLEFNATMLHDAAEMQVTAGHEYFHFVQYFYDPRSIWARASDGGPNLWLDEAASVWIERAFSDDPAQVSVVRAHNELVPLGGAAAGAPADPANHGYGLASLLLYANGLASLDDRLRGTYEDIRSGATPFAALQSHLPGAIGDWWDDYLELLVGGGLYGDVTGAMVRDERSGLFAVNGAADTLSTFHHQFADLSGRIYWVNLRYAAIDPRATLMVDADGGECSIVAFRFHADEPLVALGRSDDRLTVTGLRDLTDADCGLMVLVANRRAEAPGFDQLSPVTVTLRIGNQTDLSRFDTGILNLQYVADWSNGAHAPLQQLFLSGRDGHWIGGAFAADWDSLEVGTNHRYRGHFHVTVDPATLAVTSWDAEHRWIAAGNEGTYSLYRASGTALPLVTTTENGLMYQIDDDSVCDAISTIQVRLFTEGLLTLELVSWGCDANSRVRLDLRDEE
jgi:hypothetical protein